MGIEEHHDLDITSSGDGGVLTDEKPGLTIHDAETSSSLENQIEQELNVTEDDLMEAKAAARSMSLEEVTRVSKPSSFRNLY